MNICYDESFWEEFEILMYDLDRLENTPDTVNDLIDLLGIKADSELIDVCCGFGRISKEVALKGINTTGIDITPYYLNRAIESCKDINNANFILGDITKFDKKEEYDFAVNMFTSFGLMETEEEELDGLVNIYNSLKPGGKYLIDTQGKELAIRDFEKNIWFESGGVKVLLEYDFLYSFTVLKSRWIYFKDNQMHERTFNTRMYTAVEMAQLMAEAGFEKVEIFGDFKGNPYNINSKRLIAVGTK